MTLGAGPDDKIDVPHMVYFEKLRDFLAQVDDYTIANYLVWREIVQMAVSTTKISRQYLETFNNMLEGDLIPLVDQYHTCTSGKLEMEKRYLCD